LSTWAMAAIRPDRFVMPFDPAATPGFRVYLRV
jgi:hypothetical protein